MLTKDRKDFFATLIGIADYYGKELAEMTLELYWDGLKQYDLPAVQGALRRHTQNPDSGQFMPRIADVTKMLQGRTEDQAAVAWSKVDTAVRRVGTYADVVFDDPIVHRVLADMGGWIPLGTKTEDDWPFVAKEFMNRYRGFRERSATPDYPPVLIGMSNAQNGKQGFGRHPPVLIGDQDRAAAVMQGGTTQPLIEMRPANELQNAPRQITKH